VNGTTTKEPAMNATKISKFASVINCGNGAFNVLIREVEGGESRPVYGNHPRAQSFTWAKAVSVAKELSAEMQYQEDMAAMMKAAHAKI
jgi:hypothetical protein